MILDPKMLQGNSYIFTMDIKEAIGHNQGSTKRKMFFYCTKKRATMEEAIEHLKCQKISSAHLHNCKTMGCTLFHTGLS